MSRLARTVGVVAVGVALAAAGAGVSIALAGATPQGYRVPALPAVPAKVEPPKALNLTSLDSINQHLRSRGFDPSTFAVQQGPLNYAGPNCPGAVFNCTTATRVIQIATGGASALALLGPTAQSTPPNYADCDASPQNEAASETPSGAVGCVIVQTAPAGEQINQTASCKVESAIPDDKQVCDITQSNNSGGDNQASASMKIDSEQRQSTLTQLARQEARVHQQTVGAGNNQLQADETVALGAEGSATTQDGYQSIVFDQLVCEEAVVQEPTLVRLCLADGATGNNQAQTTQSQNFTASTATGGTQNQNARSIFAGAPPPPVEDPCPGTVEDANSCVTYNQSTGTGTNEFKANQKHDLKATSTSSNVTQVQGCDPLATFAVKPCGLEEIGLQSTADDSKNRVDVVQSGTWVLEAPIGGELCGFPRTATCDGLTQVQDPKFGGAGTTQFGGTNDALNTTQIARLIASSGDSAIQSHVNLVNDQSDGKVHTKSTIQVNDNQPSVVTCNAEGGTCTYLQECSNQPPAPPEVEGPLCPPEEEGQRDPPIESVG